MFGCDVDSMRWIVCVFHSYVIVRLLISWCCVLFVVCVVLPIDVVCYCMFHSCVVCVFAGHSYALGEGFCCV